MTKLGIVGAAGSVGSAMAFVLGLAGFFDELALTDAKKNVLESQAIDLADCLGAASDVTVVGGDFEALAGSDVVIMTASVTTRQVSSRSEYLAANLQLAKTMAGRLAKVCPEAFLINATSPVDVLVMVLRDALGWDRHRIMGFSANDSLLFRGAAAKVLGVSPVRIGGIVIGENGETQVPLFSTLTLDGEKLALSRSQETAVEKAISDWYPRWQALDSGRSSAWTSSLSMLRTMEGLLGKKAKGPTELVTYPFALTGSVLAEGEYGLSGVSMGLPLSPGQGGWGSIIELDLLQSERARLKQSALMIESQYQMTL